MTTPTAPLSPEELAAVRYTDVDDRGEQYAEVPADTWARLIAEREAQAQRIAELEARVTKDEAAKWLQAAHTYRELSVYVDSLADRGWRLGSSCHMIADTLDELHAMAERIGLKRAWFQPASSPHYDLTASRRKRAVLAGAVEVNRSEFVAVIRRLRAETTGGGQ